MCFKPRKKYEQYEAITKNRPHVVILGAGASKAAIPNGDKYKRPISCMDNFFGNMNLGYLIKGLQLETRSINLEDVYSEIDEKSKTDAAFLDAKKRIEEKVFEIFSSYVIPDEPTIYDYILLSLREKDLIASFNWDPLLIQAGRRLIDKGLITPNHMPRTIFLHGNVGAFFDPKTNRVRLHSSYDPAFGLRSKLLFPVKEKDYTRDIVIRDSWTMIEEYLKRAYIVTIFGYSAPHSDVKALEILQNAWKSFGEKNIEEIEIIDVADEDKLLENWCNFIGDCHFHCTKSLFDSFCGKFPRRTTEQLFDVTMLGIWGAVDRGFKEGMSFDEIKEFIKPLLIDESLSEERLTNPYRADLDQNHQ